MSDQNASCFNVCSLQLISRPSTLQMCLCSVLIVRWSGNLIISLNNYMLTEMDVTHMGIGLLQYLLVNMTDNFLATAK